MQVTACLSLHFSVSWYLSHIPAAVLSPRPGGPVSPAHPFADAVL